MRASLVYWAYSKCKIYFDSIERVLSMSAIWRNHANKLAQLISNNNETQAHLYLEQLMLFPVDIQDKIIEDISHLSNCNSESIADIINQYMMFELK